MAKSGTKLSPVDLTSDVPLPPEEVYTGQDWVLSWVQLT